jgi:hypothetical protein
MAPIVSDAQRRAMFAAKAGKSTLGIPQSVGADFVKAGPASSKLPKRVGYQEGGPVKGGICADPSNASMNPLCKRGDESKASGVAPSTVPLDYTAKVGGSDTAYANGGAVKDPRATRRDYAKGGPIFR